MLARRSGAGRVSSEGEQTQIIATADDSAANVVGEGWRAAQPSEENTADLCNDGMVFSDSDADGDGDTVGEETPAATMMRRARLQLFRTGTRNKVTCSEGADGRSEQRLCSSLICSCLWCI